MGILRLFLALCVASTHYRAIVLGQYGSSERDAPFVIYSTLGLDAGHAVFIFYMISGFLISYALENKYKNQTLRFYRARIKRLYPLYLCLAAVTILMTKINLNYFDIKNLWPLGLGLLGGDWVLVFKNYPKDFWSHYPPLLNPAWSLSVEAAFYLIAPFLLRAKKICLLAFILSVSARWLCLRFDAGLLYYHWFPASLYFFLAGHYSWEFFKRRRLNDGFYYCLIPAFFVLTWFGVPKTPFDNLYFYGYLTCIFFGMPVLFEKTKEIGWANFLGNLSYPIYLSHIIVLSLLFLGPNPLIPQCATCSRGWQGQAIFLLSTIITSILLHYLVEIKAVKFMQSLRNLKSKS